LLIEENILIMQSKSVSVVFIHVRLYTCTSLYMYVFIHIRPTTSEAYTVKSFFCGHQIVCFSL